jgi:hypothetical protein
MGNGEAASSRPLFQICECIIGSADDREAADHLAR